jgi:hypothetical protein
MNKVDLYVNGFRLDLFDDEEITINLSVQNVQDISKVFTDFTQGFTVPASPRNNEILQHYYNSNITSSSITTETGGSPVWNSIGITWNTWTTAWNAGASSTSVANTFDGRLRQEARIEINSLPFRTGVIEIENVQLKGTEPYAYSLTFYGDVVGLSDLFGEDYLYDIDFSAYNHTYDPDTIYSYVSSNANGTDIIYPLMSPKDNWYYDSGAGPFTGVNLEVAVSKLEYYMLKPAMKVQKILETIASNYGITFTGSFLSSAPFNLLYLWLHRREGYMYENQPTATAYELINFNTTASPTPDWFNLSTETWTPVGLSGTGDIYDVAVSVSPTSYTNDYYVGVFRNGVLMAEGIGNGTTTVTLTDIPVTNNVESLQVKIRPSTNEAMTYQVTQMTITSSGAVTSADVSMSASANYALARVIVQDQMPEIKVKDFISGLIKMYNLVIVPNSSTSFLLQPLNDWYAAGTDQDFQTYFDITEYTVNRPPLYREIEFKYQDTEQILGYQYQRTYGTGYGDLRAFFNFDADEFIVELPFECPLFERLSDLDTGNLTEILTYKSITNEANEDGTFNPYLGAPVLFYATWSLDVSSTTIGFVTDPSVPTIKNVEDIWYANTSSSPVSTAASDTIVFGSDIDPYHLQTVNQSLYNNEWSNYITDLYAKSRRLYQVEAVLPIGEIITMNLKNAVIWNNAKYLVNSVKLNMTTGKATFELLNVV